MSNGTKSEKERNAIIEECAMVAILYEGHSDGAQFAIASGIRALKNAAPSANILQVLPLPPQPETVTTSTNDDGTPTLADYLDESGVGSVIECPKCRCSISVEQQSARSSARLRPCPIGLDATPTICSAGTCTPCLAWRKYIAGTKSTAPLTEETMNPDVLQTAKNTLAAMDRNTGPLWGDNFQRDARRMAEELVRLSALSAIPATALAEVEKTKADAKMNSNSYRTEER